MDIDKLFIATKTFVDGHELTIDDDTFRKMSEAIHKKEDKNLFELENIAAENWARSRIKNYDELSEDEKALAKSGYDIKKALSNRLLQNYMDILGDAKTYAAAHASIDTITTKIKEKIVDKLRGASGTYTYGLSTMTPSFQEYRKMEFSIGKDGIAPFALNITNLALTQFAHLSMDFDHLKSFELGHLDSIYAEDDSRISDWLSAMVNAHVDVAKDPYIFILNINKATYNMTNFLLRAGKTLGTFTFLAQPVIKKFAQKSSSSSSLYGNNVTGKLTDSSDIKRMNDSRIILQLYNEYLGSSEESGGLIKAILNYNKQLPETSKQRLSDKDVKRFEQARNFYIAVANRQVTKAKKEGSKDPFENKSDLLNYDKGLEAIIAIQEEESKPINERNLKRLLDAYLFQMGTLHSWQLLSPSASKLAKLVHESQIDTEKFGNTLAKQLNFQNKYEHFRNTSDGWILNVKNYEDIVDKKKEKFKKRLAKTYGEAIPQHYLTSFASRYALDKYFSTTWLDSMFYSAKYYTKQLLAGQVFPATREFESVFKYIMGSKFGFTSWVGFDGTVHEGYNPDGGANEKIAQAVSNAIDNAMRTVAFTRMGYRMFEEIQHRHPDAIDFTMGGNTEAIYERVRDILFGNSEQADIFTRLRSLMNNIRTYKGKDGKYSMYRDPVTHDVTNALLLYLNPIPRVESDPIGKMSLTRMQSLTSDEEKVQLQAAFAQLLSSPDQDIKSIAEDLAIYAYYSQYDQNTANSFFDLVPSEYRAQYDETLSVVCKRLDDFSNEDSRKEMLLQLLQDDSYDMTTPINAVESAFSEMIMEIIAKNYWNDENIVGTYNVRQNEANLDSDRGDILGDIILDDDRKTYPSYVLSTSIQNHPKFVTIKSAGKKMLYQRIGSVIRRVRDSDKHAAPFEIYIPVQKLGYQSKNISQYEFVVDDMYGSLFYQNKIAGEFREPIVRRDVQKYVEEFESDRYDFSITYDQETIPVSRGMESAAYLNIEEGKDRDDRKILEGTTFLSSASPEYTGGGKADVIIDFHLGKDDDYLHDYAMESDKLKSKTVVVNLSTSPSEILDKVLKLKRDAPIRIHFYTPYFDVSFINDSIVSKKDVDEYVQQQLGVLEFQYRNDESINNDDIPSILDAERKFLEGRAKYNIAQAKFNEFISRLTGLLVQNQVPIERFTTSSTRQANNRKIFKTVLAKSIMQVKAAYPQYFEKQNTVYVNSEKIYSDPKARNKYMYYVQQRVSDGIVNIDYTPLEAAEVESNMLDDIARETTQNVTQDAQSIDNDTSLLDLLDSAMIETSTDDSNAIINETADTEENRDSAQNNKC